MKILLATDWSIDGANGINGVAVSVRALRRELEREGHEVLVLTLSPDNKSHLGEEVLQIGSANVGFLYPSARVRALPSRKILRRIAAWKPDVIHTQCEFSTFWFARRVARLLGVPLVHTYHTIYEDYTHYFCPVRPLQPLGAEAVKLFTRFVCARADRVIAPTEKVGRLLQNYRVGTRTEVIPSGLDLSKFGEAKKADVPLPSDRPVLLYVGRLAKEKNLDEVLRYLKFYRGAPVSFLIVGGGPHEEALRREAEGMPDNVAVRFEGMVPPALVPSYYALGDLFVCASRSETQGLTYLEAAASGVPLLCRRDECLSDLLIEGANGYGFDTRAQFLAALDDFMAKNAHARRAMGARAKRSAAKFDAAQTVPRLLAVYREAILEKALSGAPRDKKLGMLNA